MLIAVVTGGGLVMMTASVQSTAFNKTVAKMDAIDQAVLNFAIGNSRIPCPSDLTIKPGAANYGVEAATKGTCWGGTPAGNYKSASGSVEGGVPTRALQLPDDYMYDGWGRRFRKERCGGSGQGILEKAKAAL